MLQEGIQSLSSTATATTKTPVSSVEIRNTSPTPVSEPTIGNTVNCNSEHQSGQVFTLGVEPSDRPFLHIDGIDAYSQGSQPEQLSKTATQKPGAFGPVVENPGKSQSSSLMELQAIHPVIKSFLIGSVSGTCSTVLFQPLDLLKTRLQQFSPVPSPAFRHGPSSSAAATAAASPLGMVSLVGHILRHENLFSLWKGMTPSLTRCVPGVGLYFASIHTLKTTFSIDGEPSAMQSMLLGVTGRSFSGVMMIPFTVIKTRFESKVYQYNSIREAWRSIYRQEGVRGLTCGLVPTLLRDAPFSGLYLMMYTSTKKTVGKEWMDSPTVGPYVRFSCGIVAGVGASLVTQPFDVIKTKMQLYPEKFVSVRHAIPYVYEKYGIQGYFKGLMPRMIRRTLIAAMSWTLYEQLIHNLGLK